MSNNKYTMLLHGWLTQAVEKRERTRRYGFIRTLASIPKDIFSLCAAWSPESASRSLRSQWSLHHIENHGLVWILHKWNWEEQKNQPAGLSCRQHWEKTACTSPAQRYRQIPALVGVGHRWLIHVQIKQEQISFARVTSTGRRQEIFLWVWKLSVWPQTWAGSAAPIYSHDTERVKTSIESLQSTHTP